MLGKFSVGLVLAVACMSAKAEPFPMSVMLPPNFAVQFATSEVLNCRDRGWLVTQKSGHGGPPIVFGIAKRLSFSVGGVTIVMRTALDDVLCLFYDGFEG